MIALSQPKIGEIVRDRKLGLTWEVCGHGPDNRILLRRNGVIASAKFSDIEPAQVGLQLQ